MKPRWIAPLIVCALALAVVALEARAAEEEGLKAVDEAWVKGIRDQCLKANVRFFFKQWGGVFKKKTGRELEGRTWDEMPQLVTL